MEERNKAGVSKIEQNFYSHILLGLRSGISQEEIRDKLEALVPEFFYAEYDDRLPGIHPSELGGCKRRVYYSLIGEQRARPPYIEPRLGIGQAIHLIIENTFKSNSLYEVRKEISISNTEFAQKYMLRGVCDMGFYINGEPVLGVEIKSGKVPPEPILSHKIQATIYQRCLEFPYMWLYYTNRDGDLWKCFILELDKNLLEELTKIMEDLLLRATTFNPPPKEPDWMVCKKICSYFHLCKPKI